MNEIRPTQVVADLYWGITAATTQLYRLPVRVNFDYVINEALGYMANEQDISSVEVMYQQMVEELYDDYALEVDIGCIESAFLCLTQQLVNSLSHHGLYDENGDHYYRLTGWVNNSSVVLSHTPALRDRPTDVHVPAGARTFFSHQSAV